MPELLFWEFSAFLLLELEGIIDSDMDLPLAFLLVLMVADDEWPLIGGGFGSALPLGPFFFAMFFGV